MTLSMTATGTTATTAARRVVAGESESADPMPRAPACHAFPAFRCLTELRFSGRNDDGLEFQMSENEIITAVSVGMVVFMALLCCFCYPEILILGFNKLCCCCCPRRDPVSGEGQDYIGGQQSDKRRRRSRTSRTSRSRSSGRRSRSSSRRNKDVELV